MVTAVRPRGHESQAPPQEPARGSLLARSRRRLLRPMIVVPVAAVAAAAWFGLRAGSAQPTAATAATEQLSLVTSDTIRQTVPVAGTLAPASTANLAFGASGTVTAVNVKAGQQVTKGAVLATIDSAALRSQLIQAQATVDAASARVAADTTSGASAAQLSADQANLASAKLELAAAQTGLGGAVLTSPIDGTVASVALAVGQQVTGGDGSVTDLTGSGTGSGRSSASSSAGSSAEAPSAGASSAGSASSGSPQIVVISAGSYIVNLSVDDTQIGRVATGQEVTITPASLSGATAGDSAAAPGAATGTVSSVGMIATATAGVATFPVVVTVTGNPAGFYAGAAVEVEITYNRLDNVVQVPSLAVRRANGQAFVTVSQGGKKIRRAVATGLVSRGRTQITSGLRPGEQVVVAVPTQSNAENGTQQQRGDGFGGGGGPHGGGGFGGGAGEEGEGG